MRRAAGAAGVALGVLVAVAPLAAQDLPSPTGPTHFSVMGLADGVTAEFEIEGLLPVDELVGLSSVTSEAHLGLGRADALAALPDPGDLVLTLPGTLAGLSGVTGLPDYPAAARAEHPAVAEDEVVFVPDGGLGAGRLRALAAEDSSSSSAAVTEVVDAVGLLPGFSIGSMRTEATTRRLDPASYRATATSTLSDVRLLGGLVRIDEITTEVRAEVLRGRFAAEAPTVHVAGVAVAGQPVAIGDEGVVAMGQGQALAPVIGQLTRPLADAGIDIRTTPGSEAVEDGRAVATAATVTIEAPLEVQGRPGRFTLTFGRATASVAAGGGAGPEAAGGGGGEGGGDAVDVAASPARPPLPPGSAPPAGPAVPSPPAGSPGADAGSTGAEPLVAIGGGREVQDWQVVAAYRAIALGGVLALAGARVVRRLAATDRSDLRSLWRW